MPPIFRRVVETVPRETIDVTESTKSATSATSKEFIKPTDVPILNWKTKSVKNYKIIEINILIMLLENITNLMAVILIK